MILRKGDKGSAVTKVQKALKMKLTNYGTFGDVTEAKVKAFQTSKGLDNDGVVGTDTIKALGLTEAMLEETLSTDLSKSTVPVDINASHTPLNVLGKDVLNTYAKDGVIMNIQMLDKDEYHNETFSKQWLILHHTAGGHNPYATVKQWNDDARGKIATEYVLGGLSTSNGDAKFDGEVVQCMPDKTWAAHLGDNGNSLYHKMSIGIEVCNYGPLTKGYYKKDGVKITKDANKFYNYVGGVVPNDQVCDLGFSFRGYQFYHRYTDKQIESLKLLITHIRDKHQINVRQGLVECLMNETAASAFGYKVEAYKGTVKGMWTHTNIRKDKSDMSPQPHLIEMLLTLK